MSFFNLPVYDIPDETKGATLAFDKSLNIIVKDDDYQEAQSTLLSKILGSVKQDIDQAELAKLEADNCNILSTTNSPCLILVFGLSPAQCGLQVDKTPYRLISISNKTFIFSNSLGNLPSSPESRKALWMALKAYYKMT